MKRYIITALCAFVAYCAWGQLNNPCFRIPIPENTPSTYSLHNFTQDSATVDLDNTLLYALAISGNVTLTSDMNSSVKVILVENNGIQHLVYEVNSLLANTNSFSIENVGRETLWDFPIYASKLLVRLKNATLTLNAITPITELLPNATPQQKALRMQEQNDTIVNILNRNLIARDIPWRAGNTSLSTLPYEDKIVVLGDNNPFYNIEYYIGGYYVDPAFEATQATAVDDGYIEEFDWRNHHGKNWITPVRNQYKCGACGPFAAVALLEAYINLYFNKLFNLDLSEQEMVSRLMSDCEDGVRPQDVSEQIFQTGIMSEADFNYNSNTWSGITTNINIPTEYNTKLLIDRPFSPCSTYFNAYTEAEYKERLFQSPYTFGKRSAKHVMLLVGYKRAEVGEIDHDIINENGAGDILDIYIDDDSNLIGKTVWICKNSWGSNPGYKGYIYLITNLSEIEWASYFNGLLILNDYNNIYNYDDIQITDNDGDGYYYWGVGVRPMHTPEWVPYNADGDDGNPLLGPMNEYGYCDEIGPTEENSLKMNIGNNYCATPLLHRGNVIIPSGATLLVTSHMTMHKDAKIIINGGKLIIDGGTIHNGDILNKGSVIIKNGGRVEMRSDDEFINNAPSVTIENNGYEPFPLKVEIEHGALVHI